MEHIKRPSTDILQLFSETDYLKICAPMVRYSKLQFRTLVRQYGCDLAYTPMILADSFCLSEKARNNEFTTNACDTPLIVQFAANKIHDFVGAAYMVSPYCDGVDLNCGCPQRWAKQLGLGCSMLEKPEVLSSIVKECRNIIPKPFTISVKLRILKDLRKTVELCKQLENSGVSFLSIHARTASQLTGPINVEALKLIRENVGCPVVANGGLKTLEECEFLYRKTNCKGVMIANGILANPTIFSGTEIVSKDCIQKWLDICYNTTLNYNDFKCLTLENCSKIFAEKPKNLTFQCFHHHLVFMLEKVLSKYKRRIFNNLQTFSQVLEFLNTEFNLSPNIYSLNNFNKNLSVDINYANRSFLYNEYKKRYNVENDITESTMPIYNSKHSNGKYFSSKINDDSDSEFDLNNLFIEIE